MTAQFGVLASGSGGNSSVLLTKTTGLMIDLGIGPRLLASRMSQLGLSWARIQAVLLTHAHGDHWKESSLLHLWRLQVPIYCHPRHHERLMRGVRAYRPLHAAGLIRDFHDDVPFNPIPNVTCRPIEISHDSRPTFAFRLDGAATLFGPGWSLGYVSDLGCFDDRLVEMMSDVDLLGLEFNHDPEMERRSGRTRHHIERVLGNEGHLSNEQAGDYLRAHFLRSSPERLRHLIQLHLSRDCNRPPLAVDAARRALNEYDCDARIWTAEQDRPTPLIGLEESRPRSASRSTRSGPRPRPTQSFLPGFGD